MQRNLHPNGLSRRRIVLYVFSLSPLLLLLLLAYRYATGSVNNNDALTFPRQPTRFLRVVVWSDTGCDGIGCEDKLGGSRIWCTNLGAGLRLLGHDVSFTTEQPKSSLYQSIDVILVHANKVRSTTGIGHRLSKLSRIAVLAKPNGMQTELMNSFGLIPFGSLLHFQHELSKGLQHQRGYIAKHIEVPLKFWRQARHDPQVAMYDFIPRHVPFHQPFSQQRKAKLCYHGSIGHVVEEGSKDMWEAIDNLQSELPLEAVVMSGEILSQIADHADFMRSRPNVKFLKWESTDKLFAFLASCDIGLAPNYSDRPELSENGSLPYPQLRLSYKSSVNGGRAFVFAQVGLPFVGHPELELAEIAASSNIASDKILASGAQDWLVKLRNILQNPAARNKISVNLRSYAENVLTIKEEARKLEEELTTRMK